VHGGGPFVAFTPDRHNPRRPLGIHVQDLDLLERPTDQIDPIAMTIRIRELFAILLAWGFQRFSWPRRLARP
jgi:hypothetical protein